MNSSPRGINTISDNSHLDWLINDNGYINNFVDTMPINPTNLEPTFEMIAAEGLINLSTGFFGTFNENSALNTELEPSGRRGTGRPWSIRSQIICLDTAEELAQSTECYICFEPDVRAVDMVETNCNHSFCHRCVTTHLENIKFRHVAPDCPMCRTQISVLTTKDIEILTDLDQRYSQLTATAHLIPEIHEEFDEFDFNPAVFDLSNALLELDSSRMVRR